MRKTLKFAGLALIPVVLAAGCGSSGGNNSTGNSGGNGNSTAKSTGGVVNITVWDAYAQTGPGGGTFKKLVDSFNASHPNIHVTEQFITNVDNFLPKIQTALAGNQEPDLVADGGPTWGASLASTGKVVDLTPFLNSSTTLHAGDFYPGMLDASTYKGKVLGVPNDGGTIGIFYNKDLFKQAGLDPNNPPTTWDGLVKDAVQIKQKTGVDGYDVPIGNQEWTVWMWEGLLWANGGTLIDTSSSPAKVEFNSPAGVQSLQMWIDLIHKYKAAPTTAIPSGTSLATVLQKKQVAMIDDGPWDIGPLQTAKYPLGVMAFPQGSGGSPATLLGTDVFYVFNTGSAKEKAAWQFIEYCMNANRLATWDVQNGFVPTTKTAAATSTYQNFLASNPDLKTLVNGLQYGHARPDLVSYDAISAELGQYIEKALYGQMTAKAALDAAAQQAQQILSSNKE